MNKPTQNPGAQVAKARPVGPRTCEELGVCQSRSGADLCRINCGRPGSPADVPEESPVGVWEQVALVALCAVCVAAAVFVVMAGAGYLLESFT